MITLAFHFSAQVLRKMKLRANSENPDFYYTKKFCYPKWAILVREMPPKYRFNKNSCFDLEETLSFHSCKEITSKNDSCCLLLGTLGNCIAVHVQCTHQQTAGHLWSVQLLTSARSATVKYTDKYVVCSCTRYWNFRIYIFLIFLRVST